MFTQLVLASRDDNGGWIQLLVLVVFAAIYALRSLLKARGTGADDARQAQKPRETTYKPRPGRGAAPRPVPRQSRPRPATAPPPAQLPSQRKAPPRQILRPVQTPPPLLEMNKQGQAVGKVQLPDFARVITSAVGQGDSVEPAGGSTGPRVQVARAVAPESVDRDYLADILADYADPDQLRAAILHYEILGKPISLRDPSQQVIGP